MYRNDEHELREIRREGCRREYMTAREYILARDNDPIEPPDRVFAEEN